MLLDTNIVSEIIRPKPHPSVQKWARAQAYAAISCITLNEIVFGLTRRQLPSVSARFESLALATDVFDVTNTIARAAGIMRGQFAAKGIARSTEDMLIAATAQAHGLTLATRKVRDFEGCGIAVFNPFD
jgi:toxin FitB